MKVLDLQCAQSHRFEGWFASEDDFQGQLLASLVQCPLCGSAHVTKRLSAPRLNLGSDRQDPPPAAVKSSALEIDSGSPMEQLRALRKMVARAEDVGERFSDEARKMHYGERPERSIRGQASPAQTLELMEEGIAVLPLPDILKEPLH
jgi:hypothetical protein